MTDNIDNKEIEIIKAKRDKSGRFIPGFPGNPRKIYASKKKEIYHRIMQEADELLNIAIEDAKNGDKKMLIFLLSRILPQKGVLEVAHQQIRLSEDATKNVKAIVRAFSREELTIDDLNQLMGAIQKQAEIQSNDLVVLNEKVNEIKKEMGKNDD